MREKAMRVIVTFHTTAEAIATETMCRVRGINGKLISAPRSLSADCGIAWSSAPEQRTALERGLAEERIEIAGIFEMLR